MHIILARRVKICIGWYWYRFILHYNAVYWTLQLRCILDEATWRIYWIRGLLRSIHIEHLGRWVARYLTAMISPIPMPTMRKKIPTSIKGVDATGVSLGTDCSGGACGSDDFKGFPMGVVHLRKACDLFWTVLLWEREEIGALLHNIVFFWSMQISLL